jgi:hypothetical protein
MVALSTPSSVVVRSTAPSIFVSAPPDAPWRLKTSNEGETVWECTYSGLPDSGSCVGGIVVMRMYVANLGSSYP